MGMVTTGTLDFTIEEFNCNAANNIILSIAWLAPFIVTIQSG
jgi:hypothetical protein